MKAFKLLFSFLSFLSLSTIEAKSTADGHFEVAKKLILQGNHNDALQQLEMAVSIDPNDHLVRFKRAAILLGMGRNTQALADLNTILESKPDFEQVQFSEYVLISE